MRTENSTSRRRFLRGGLAAGALAAAPGTSMQAPDSLAANETLVTIQRLRTIHGDFSERTLRADLLETIIAASVRAANASNMQSYSIIVSREPVKIQKLTTYRSPCLLLYCADYNRLLDIAKHLGHNF